MNEISDYGDEILALNKAELNRELYFEAVRGMSMKKRDILFMIAGLILTPLCVMLGSKTAAAMAFALAVISVLYRPLLGHRDYKKLCRRYPDGTWVKTVAFYRDCIVLTSDSGQRTASYENLKKIRQTEHLYILDFGKNEPASILTKSGFTQGSIEEVKAALKEHEQAEADRRANAETVG